MRHTRIAVALLLSLLSLPALAAITGTVMNSDGQPVAGARVTLHVIETPAARRERLLSASPQPVALAETKSDAKGAFSLASPKEALVDLRVDMRGYAPEVRRVEKDEELGAMLVTALDMKQATITAAGKPVANATVVINYSGAEYVARTDAQGKYEAPDPKGARVITVLHPDFAIDEENFMMQGRSTPASELTRTLSAGAALSGKVVSQDGKSPVAKAVISIDGWPVATSGDDGSFVVAHAPTKWTTLTARKEPLGGQHAFASGKPLTVRVEREGTISGRILDAKTKVPVPGVTVRVNQTRRFQGVDTAMMAITDAKGAYSLSAPAGTFMLVASHPAYDLASADVTVAAAQAVTRDLNVTQLARVTGVVVDEEGKGVVAARVRSENAGTEMMRMMMFRDGGNVLTGTDGRFAIRIRAEADQLLRATKKGLPQAKSETVKLQPGERKSGMVLTMPSGIAVTGRVLDPSGTALSGVAVSASETPTGNDRMMMRRVMIGGFMSDDDDSVRTASDGSFTLRLKEGTYDFTFKREGFAPKSIRAQSVAANASRPLETRLDVAAEISGRVTRGGAGVPDVMVSSFGEGDNPTAVTGPDGSFTLTGLPAGSTRMSLRKEDALINEQRVVTAPARDLVIELPAGGTIRGRVVEKGSSKPITSFQAGVSASRSGGGMVMMSAPLLRSFTSDDGSFVLENVPPGATNLIANATGYSPARLNVDVPEGKTVSDIVLELEQGVRLTGKVTGPNGSPLADASVMVQPSPTGSFAMTGSLRRATTDANGEYTLEGLTPGEETIQFGHPKYTGMSRTVTLKGRESKLDVQLEGGTRISGVVVTDSGAPVADAEVEAFSASGGNYSARTNASGTFEIDAMRPARYRFTAAKNGYMEGRMDDVDVSAGSPVRLVLQTGGTIYGRVTGVTEAEMANVTVSARSGRASAGAPVDPQGNFRIDGAPTGTVSVSATVQPRDYGSRRTSSVQTVELAAGGSQQVTIDFRGDVVIRGRVTRNGKALAGANVMFYPRKSGSQPSAAVSTDEQGLYSVSGLGEGEYSVSVTDVQRFSPFMTTYQVRGSATYDIDFKAGTVRGRVIDAATNEPVNNATVQFRASMPGQEMRGGRTVVTDSNGVFTVDFVHAGSYVVSASRDGYGNAVLETTFGESGRDDLELKLSRNDGVTVTLVDARDQSTLSGQVAVFDAQGRPVYDSRANFRFGDAAKEMRLPLAPGSYTATIFVQDYAPMHVTLTSPSTPRFMMSPGGTILVRSKYDVRRRIRLLDASGMPYPRVGTMPMIRDVPPGTIPLEHIAPGSYTLVLLNDDDTPAASQTVVVRERQTVTVDL
ncbi:MAG TPA: carboxypeptidase regulatory-like domain-containing protein [Thermoanaerobaculia bacterium]|nr:carboxypeptidase regulatory-like domain-containing protein [Thermoanaerobaculia bacterium]